MKYASEEMKNNKEILLTAYQQMGLKFTAKESEDIEMITLTAVKQKRSALEVASEEMKNDTAIVMATFQNMGLKYPAEDMTSCVMLSWQPFGRKVMYCSTAPRR